MVAGVMINKSSEPINAITFQGKLLNRISVELRAARRPDVWDKHAWLFDRIAPRVGASTRAIGIAPRPTGD